VNKNDKGVEKGLKALLEIVTETLEQLLFFIPVFTFSDHDESLTLHFA